MYVQLDCKNGVRSAALQEDRPLPLMRRRTSVLSHSLIVVINPTTPPHHPPSTIRVQDNVSVIGKKPLGTELVICSVCGVIALPANTARSR